MGDESMIGKLAKTSLLALALLVATACGGNSPPENEDPAGNEPGGRAAASAPAPTRIQATAPTRPPRLDSLLTPAAQERQVRATAEAEEKTQARTREPAQDAGSAETAGTTPAETIAPGDVASLVPPDPRFADEVLLQDIYARMDLGEFALDPDEPIEWASGDHIANRRELEGHSLMEYPMVHEHPFLHLFPSIQEYIDEQEKPKDLWYNPNNRSQTHESLSRRDRRDISAARNGIIYFIHHPWFEPVHFGTRTNYNWADGAPYGPSARGRGSVFRIFSTRWPHWFGDNSTRGILLETVVGLLEEAKVPGVTPHPQSWWKEGTTYDWYDDEDNLEDRDWTLEEFTANTVSFMEGDRLRAVEDHRTPRVEWEILHPQLPILRVTVHTDQLLPLAQVAQDGARLNTRYSVSFVMTLQNRWASFEDPNRWLLRFREDLELYQVPPWKLEEDLPYPNYWDDTDYMQHRIIGPVVMTVHEVKPNPSLSLNEDQVAAIMAAQVLRPGNYSMAPRIDHWEAPGHILTDRQVPTAKRLIIHYSVYDPSLSSTVDRPEDPGFRQWPAFQDPNAGFPLPGHVLTTPETGPGTEVWKEKGMEGNDW